MTPQDNEFVARLFNPTTPRPATAPRVDVTEVLAVSDGFPATGEDADRTVLRDIESRYTDSDFLGSTDVAVQKFATAAAVLPPIQTVAELKALAGRSEFNGYAAILRSFTIYLLLQRQYEALSQRFGGIDFGRLRDTFAALFAAGSKNDDEARSRSLAGRLSWAIYAAESGKLDRKQLPVVFRNDPRFTFEPVSYEIRSSALPGSRSSRSVRLHKRRRDLLRLSRKARELESMVAAAARGAGTSSQRMIQRYDSIQRHLAGNRPTGGPRRRMRILGRAVGGTVGRPLVDVSETPDADSTLVSRVAQAIGERETPDDGTFLRIGDLARELFGALFPLLLGRALDESARQLLASDPIRSFASVADARSHLKGNEPDIVVVREDILSNRDRELLRIFDLDFARYRPISHVTIGAHDDLLEIDVGRFRYPHLLEEISTRLKSVDSESAALAAQDCAQLAEQSETPTFVNEYPLADFSERIFPAITVGVGELAILRKRWIGWSVGGIAKIVNVLPGAETTVYDESVTETTSRMASETTTQEARRSERTDKVSKEINKAVQETHQEQLEFQAGLSASFELGMTSVEANTQFGYRKAETETTNENRRFAKELVTKAVSEMSSETFERSEEEVRELIKHTEKSTLTGPDSEKSYAVGYVNDVFEFEVVRWDKRLILELYIPEPAIEFLEPYIDGRREPPLPLLFKGTAQDIHEEDWICLQSRYPEITIPQPPQLVTTAPIKQKTAIVEERDEWGEDLIEDQVEVPEGYAPERVAVSINVQGTTDRTTEWAVSIAGRKLVEDSASDLAADSHVDKTFDYEVYLTEESALFGQDDTPDVAIWSPGNTIEYIPISAKFRNHYDKAAYLNMMFYFRRTHERLLQWKTNVFSLIKEADTQRMADYEIAMRDMENSVNVDTDQVVSEDRVKSELKRWFYKALLGRPLELDVLERIDEDSGQLEPSFSQEGEYLEVYRFHECFDWRNVRYVPLDQNLGVRDLRPFKNRVKSRDYFLDRFVKAGAARVSIPVQPGRELWVLNFLALRTPANQVGSSTSELLEQARESAGVGEYDSSIQMFDVLADIFYNAPGDVDYAQGVGKLKLTSNQRDATLDLSGNLLISSGFDLWTPDNDDAGREIMVEGDLYSISEVKDDGTIVLDRPWAGSSDTYSYLIGPQRIGDPWKVAVPSGEVRLMTEAEFADLRQS